MVSNSGLVLMSATWQIDVSVEEYQIVTGDNFPYFPNEYFLAPRYMAEGYASALKVVSDLEIYLERCREASGHRIWFERTNQ